MKIPIILLSFFLLSINKANAQFTRYLVKLKDKGRNPYSLADPSAYLTQRAIERRTRYNIPIDSTDLPVTRDYLSQIAAIPNVTVINISKWLNYVAIQTTDSNAINAINALPFVTNVSGIAARLMPGRKIPVNKFNNETATTASPSSLKENGIPGDYYNYGTAAYNEISLHHGNFLHNIGMHGEGMQLAMLDAGYINYTTYFAFDSVNANNQVLGTWNFVARNSNVVQSSAHGMACFSDIAANMPGQFVGNAPKTQFYLYVTEDVTSEYPIEELNWVCGAEKADSLGVDIISSSLGYSTFDNSSLDHTYADMNGKTTIAARGATIASRKGMLVFVAAGNEGTSAWHYIMTPADADSIITVGAVNVSGAPGAFSSYGPSSDGRVKPDVASVGVSAVIETSANTVGYGNGTSFATPKMAGLGTCLWQAFPEFNNMKIIKAIQSSGSIYNQPDNRIGYGIPDMKKAFGILLKSFATATAAVNNCTVTLNWTSKDVSAMKYEIEQKTSNDTSYIKIGDAQPAQGSILNINSYQYSASISGLPAGIVSYRIKQIIDTSSAGFSALYLDTLNLTASSLCSANTPAGNDSIFIAPNPVPGNQNLQIVVDTKLAASSLTFRIVDMKGSLLYQMTSSKGTGRAIFSIPAGQFPKGIYSVTVYSQAKKTGTARFVKL
jgi:hypothetical protein